MSIDKEFLRRVWEAQPKGTHLFLCSKSNLGEATKSKTGNIKREGKWSDHSFTSIKAALKWLDKVGPGIDLYWCPTWFNGPQRLKGNVVGSKFLWADLDEANPKKIDKALKPSVAWESSPKRYQALWELDEAITPTDVEQANRAVAYALHDQGADKGGWDLSQVLRIPGAPNLKYGDSEDAPVSKLLWFRDNPQPVKQIKLAASMKTQPEESDVVSFEPTEEVSEDFAKLISKYRKKLGPKIIGLLLQPEAEEGRRSDVLWYLEHELIKRGLSVQEGIALIRGSVWNKYEGRRDEVERLTHEFSRALEDEVIDAPSKKPSKEERQKIKEEVSENYVEPVTSFNVVTDSQLMSNPRTQPGWLVKGFWTKKSHGIVAGQPKSFKSTLLMDMMISVASGEPFLGAFPVEQKGPVLLIQNENADWIMKDRLEKIRTAKGLCGECSVGSDGNLNINWAPELPIYYINQQGFTLTDETHRKLMVELLEQIKPVLVILDPLYLMFGGDLNSAKELNPVLSWLLNTKEKYNTSLVVVHHYNKGGADKRGGQRMLGSATLHGWTESAWYIETRTVDEPPPEDDGDFDALKATGKAEVTIEREFRGAGMHPKVDLVIQMGEFADPLYDVQVAKHKPIEKPKKGGKKEAPEEPSKNQLTKELVTQMSMSKKSWTQRKIMETLGIGKRIMDQLMGELIEEGILADDGAGYRLVEY